MKFCVGDLVMAPGSDEHMLVVRIFDSKFIELSNPTMLPGCIMMEGMLTLYKSAAEIRREKIEKLLDV